MSVLNQLGIIVGDNTKAETAFLSLHPNFFQINYKKPSEYVDYLWKRYTATPGRSNNINGKVFEYILATLFIREQFLPLFFSAKVAYVPNVIYDIMMYTEEFGPICFSAKTSLRERYKQADLEAFALKNVHRRAQSYLITMSSGEAESVKKKIASGDVIGLNDVIVADSDELDKLIAKIKLLTLIHPPEVKAISSNQIVTKDIVDNLI